MKKKINIILILFVIFSLTFLYGCKDRPIDSPEKYSIEYVTEEKLENATYTYEKESGKIVLPVLEKELYDFLGWSLEGDETIYTSFLSSDFSKDLKFYPVFEKSEKLLEIEDIDAQSLIVEEDKDLALLEQRYLQLTDIEQGYLANLSVLKSKINTSKNNYEEELLAKEKAITTYLGNEWVENENRYFQKLTLSEVLEKNAWVNEWIDQEANLIVNMINELDNPTLEEAKNVNDIYTNSIVYVKEKVSNINVLNEILKSLNEETYKSFASSIIEKIKLLPKYIDLDDEQVVNQIISEYNDLPNEAKLYVENYDLLLNASSTIENIKNNKQEIAYVLGHDVFETKEELYRSYYADLYYFILANNGSSNLANNQINSLEDFLVLGVNPNGGGTTNMRGIGNIAGGYYLARDYNGLLKDQPTTKFFGYMYQNNKYEEFLEFLVRFFAYWRIDEKYATETNRGADIFAEAWAPMVDTSKFFYYTADTSYVKTERMQDCFNLIPGVLNITLPKTLEIGLELPYNITRRGYIFDGWYTNSEYSGNKVYTITEELINSYENKKVILYAKWVKDESAVNKDLAATVDVIINNLMPTLSEVDQAIVAKARYMYDILPEEAKKLVTLYDKLIRSEIMVEGELTSDILVTYELNGGSFASYLSLDEMYRDFVNDFKSYTSVDLSDPNVFINNRYTLMRNLYSFYQNSQMYNKWVFLAKYFKDSSTANGLIIQSNRVINQQSGDLEYFSKALGILFTKQNGLTDNEVLLDASESNVIDEVVSYIDTTSEILYTANTMLKTPTKEGYNFGGWYIDEDFTIRVYSVKQIEKYNVSKVYAKWEK